MPLPRVLKALKAQGVKMLGLRCSGTNNVDKDAADELGPCWVNSAGSAGLESKRLLLLQIVT